MLKRVFEYCWVYTIAISPRERVEKDMVMK